VARVSHQTRKTTDRSSGQEEGRDDPSVGKRSFLEVLTIGIVGHDGRGRGRGFDGRFEEEPWGGAPRWWNPGFPQGMFPPQHFQPPPYGFYPSHMGPPHPHPPNFITRHLQCSHRCRRSRSLGSLVVKAIGQGLEFRGRGSWTTS
jgi:hypothetical protein